ncbi:MAG: hypothetical protein JWN53_906, partial [Gemmatimonadetes bacterium]|nr:hypothetical protein [Gemmatimonadota bacterium]
FENLPDASRVWIFGSDRPLTEEATTTLLKGVDEYLTEWKAHGAPLTVASQFRDARFLVVAVDQSTTGATGCSIDGLFRVLQGLESRIGASLVGGGRVFYRDATASVQSASRSEVPALAASGAITKDTVVFDTSITDLGQFRSGFEKRAKESWVKEMLPPEQR